MNRYAGSGGTTPLIPNLGLRDRLSVLPGSLSREGWVSTGNFGEEKNLFPVSLSIQHSFLQSTAE